MNMQRARKLLKEFELKRLFIEELGWDHHTSSICISVDGFSFDLYAVAHKRGMVAFSCSIPDIQTVNYGVRSKIENQLARHVREHIVIFRDESDTIQIWQWVKRQTGKPIERREHKYWVSQNGDSLLQKLYALEVTMEDEETIDLLGVTSRARKAFDLDRVTKKFYESFKKEHGEFLTVITGIPLLEDREWYASIMLNRLMFIYFIQKKGFLDNDLDYLRNRLAMVQEASGENKFQTFYRYFLVRLFHDGLGTSREKRRIEPALEQLLGNVPYLNGGFFEVHPLEVRNVEIDIPDSAFSKLFVFFDKYAWHLDDRPLLNDNEVNPDVIGYIFEKYINQKQMGAYYTKEDITEYISKSTIIPHILDTASDLCRTSNSPDCIPWNLLKSNPERYIYPSSMHGVIDDSGKTIPLPNSILECLTGNDLQSNLSHTAPSPFGHPDETWYEYIERRKSCLNVREILLNGNVSSVQDLVTFNLDLWMFARDAISSCEYPTSLFFLWKRIQGISIIDPTCGSGAFLFAALRILQSLYSLCLDKMQSFIDEPSTDPDKDVTIREFTTILKKVQSHYNTDYFILKSIIIYNLYGVDIMDEAIEICKLRLFLKLVAQTDSTEHLDPLPDIDFNIRTGNALVGYTSMAQLERSMKGDLIKQLQLPQVKNQALVIEEIYNRFREQQIQNCARPDYSLKQKLRTHLEALRDVLDKQMVKEYGITSGDEEEQAEWKTTHSPFHWLIEFYSIIQSGGFDVVIGNPPYVASSSTNYLSNEVRTLKIPDLYGHVMLRSLDISNGEGTLGLIVPLSVTFGRAFANLRKAITTSGNAWFSSFDNIPAALFTGVSQRCSIWLGDHRGSTGYSTPLYRWRSSGRPKLLYNVSYSELPEELDTAKGIPRTSNSSFVEEVLHIHTDLKPQRGFLLRSRKGGYPVYFSPSARNFVSAFCSAPPCLDALTLSLLPNGSPQINLTEPKFVEVANLALAGELFFYYWLTWGDGFHVTRGVISAFLELLEYLPDYCIQALDLLGHSLWRRRNEALVFKRNAGKFVGNYNFKQHTWLTRRADLVIMAGLGIRKTTALSILTHVQRVLSINVFAGEKGIPPELKSRYPHLPVDLDSENKALENADKIIRTSYGDEVLRCLPNSRQTADVL